MLPQQVVGCLKGFPLRLWSHQVVRIVEVPLRRRFWNVLRNHKTRLAQNKLLFIFVVFSFQPFLYLLHPAYSCLPSHFIYIPHFLFVLFGAADGQGFLGMDEEDVSRLFLFLKVGELGVVHLMATGHSLYDGGIAVHEEVEEGHQSGTLLGEAFRLSQDNYVTLVPQLLEVPEGDGVADTSVQQQVTL